MAKLTPRQRNQIIAEYAAGGISQEKLSEKYNVSRQAISKILGSEKGCEKLRAKKEENERSMLEFLDSRKEQAQSLMEAILNSSKESIERVNWIVTAMKESK